MSTKYKFIDLFAGCGGMSLGLEQAGFEPVLYNELNPSAAETYRINRHPIEYVADIHNIDEKHVIKQDDEKGNKKRALRPVVDHLGVSVFLEPIFLLSLLLEEILLVIVPSAESLVTEIGGETL